MGFEPGETQNLNSINDFLWARSGETVPLKDRVHIIWLCIKVPHSGSRVLETGDEDLLKLAFELQVPIVVVFTQYDILFNAMYRRLPRTATSDQRAEAAEAEFQELCVKPLDQIKVNLPRARTSGLSGGRSAKPNWDALDDLVKTTGELIEKQFGDAWIVSAMAQRTNVEQKISGATAVGMKSYWQGLASSAKFPGWKLEKCLNTVHKEMTDSWNLYDPDDLLQKPDFLGRIRTVAQLVTPNDLDEAKSNLPKFNQIETLLGFAAATGLAAAVPAIAAIGLSLWFLNLLFQTYRDTPETLRCFMGYIIDLSLVMDQLFHITIARAARPLTDKDIDEALENYKNANLGAVHREIRAYAGKATIKEILA
ncbi:hypothetical protein C8R46DRAFT_1358260, partial [Mycena filopes]